MSETELFESCRTNDADRVQQLLSSGVSVNSRDSHGHTPLHVASEVGSMEVVKLLIDHGAQVNAPMVLYGNMINYTPVDAAASRGHLEVTKYLSDNGGLLYEPDGYLGYHSAMLGAAASGNIDLVKYLHEEKKVPIDEADAMGVRPLHDAIEKVHEHIVLYLIEHGANPNAKTGCQPSPIDYIREKILSEKYDNSMKQKFQDILTHMTQPTRSPQEGFASLAGRFSDLRDPDCLKRAERAIRTGKQKSEDAVDELIAMLRSKITFQVAKQQSEDDVGEMIAVLLSEGFFIEQAALSQALGRIGDKRALPVLRETLRALHDKPYLMNGLAAWSIQGTKATLLPESFRDLDEDVNGIYTHEQAALHADAGNVRQVCEAIVNAFRKEYFFRSVLMAVAQLGESEDIAEITPFLTWTWHGNALIEPHKAAAEALVLLLERLPADGSLYDELKQLETSVRRSKEHATKQGWRTEEHTDKALAAVGRKHRALRKQLRAQARTSKAQDTSPRSWWKFWT